MNACSLKRDNRWNCCLYLNYKTNLNVNHHISSFCIHFVLAHLGAKPHIPVSKTLRIPVAKPNQTLRIPGEQLDSWGYWTFCSYNSDSFCRVWTRCDNMTCNSETVLSFCLQSCWQQFGHLEKLGEALHPATLAKFPASFAHHSPPPPSGSSPAWEIGG